MSHAPARPKGPPHGHHLQDPAQALAVLQGRPPREQFHGVLAADLSYETFRVVIGKADPITKGLDGVGRLLALPDLEKGRRRIDQRDRAVHRPHGSALEDEGLLPRTSVAPLFGVLAAQILQELPPPERGDLVMVLREIVNRVGGLLVVMEHEITDDALVAAQIDGHHP